jgi:hypothetical protein
MDSWSHTQYSIDMSNKDCVAGVLFVLKFFNASNQNFIKNEMFSELNKIH